MRAKGKKLTEKVIRDAKPSGRLTSTNKPLTDFLWDVGGIPGFGVRITPAGARSYVVWYRTAKHRERRLMVLGNVQTKSLERARKDARAILAAVDSGSDPVKERRLANRGDTIKDLMARYMKEWAALQKSKSSQLSDQRLIDGIVNPALGGRRVAALTPADIAAFHATHADTPFQANRALALLSKAMTLAAVWGLRPTGSNPCKGIQRFKEPRRDRRIMPAELVEIGKALQQAEAENSEQPGCITAIRLLAMSGCRASEICNARWVDIDLGARLLRLPHSKTGARVVSIGSAAVGFLSGLPPNGAYVCHGPDSRKPLSLWTLEGAWRRIRDTAKVPDLRLHDLRHAAATAAADAGFSAFQVKALLGHSSIAMAQRYVSAATDPARGAADHVAAQMAAVLAGQPTRNKR